MQDESGNEQVVAMISGDLTPTNAEPVSPSGDSQVKRTWKRLYYSLALCFGAYVGNFFFWIFVAPINIDAINAAKNLETGHALIGLIFCCFGVFVACGKDKKTTRVFAWLSMIMAIFTCVINIILFFYMVLPLVTFNTSDDGKSKILRFSLIICNAIISRIFTCLLMVLITKWAFKLAKQIDANKHATSQAI